MRTDDQVPIVFWMNAPRRKWEGLPCGRNNRSRAHVGRGSRKQSRDPDKPRRRESVVVVGESEKEEDGGRRTMGLGGAPKVFWALKCTRVIRWPGPHLSDTHSRGRYSQLSLTLTLGAKICWDKVVAPKVSNSVNSEAIGIPPPPGRLPSQLPST